MEVQKKLITKGGKASAFLLHFHGTFFSDHARASRRIDSSQLESSNVECRLLVQRDFSPDFPVKNGEYLPPCLSWQCDLDKNFFQVKSNSSTYEFILYGSIQYIFDTTQKEMVPHKKIIDNVEQNFVFEKNDYINRKINKVI